MHLKRIVVLLSVLVGVGAIGMNSTGFSLAQETTAFLPADLLFTIPHPSENNSWTEADDRLMRVDAQTGQIRPFYIEQAPVGQLWALSWSPQGDRLAFLRTYPDPEARFFPRELCILDRDGQLQGCMEDRPPMYLAYSGEDRDYEVVWSDDGERLYFSAERDISATASDRVIVEADVSTGKTLRTLYTYSYDPDLGQISSALAWSPHPDTVLVGGGDTWGNREVMHAPVMLVDLATGRETHIPALLPEHMTLGYVCPHFSPRGTYVSLYASYNLDAYNPWGLPTLMHNFYQLLLMDKGGRVLARLAEPTDEGFIQFWGCPTWEPDEQAFYVVGSQNGNGASTVFRYELATQQLTEYVSGDVVPPLKLSPTGGYLAFMAPLAIGASGQLVTRVLTPTGEIITFPEFAYAPFPVWVPPTLEAGRQARVHVLNEDALSVRAGPGLDFAIQERLEDGALVDVLEGPERADGYEWWRVRTPSGAEGWVVQTADGVRTLQVVP